MKDPNDVCDNNDNKNDNDGDVKLGKNIQNIQNIQYIYIQIYTLDFASCSMLPILSRNGLLILTQ